MELGQLVAGEDVVAEQRGQEAEPVGVQVQCLGHFVNAVLWEREENNIII